MDQTNLEHYLRCDLAYLAQVDSKSNPAQKALNPDSDSHISGLNLADVIIYTLPLMLFEKFGLKIDLESIIELEMVSITDSEFLGRFRTLMC